MNQGTPGHTALQVRAEPHLYLPVRLEKMGWLKSRKLGGRPGKETVVRKDFLLAGLLWPGLTAIGVVMLIQWDYPPLAAAEQADIIDKAFEILVYIPIPVIAFVFAAVPLRRRRLGVHLSGIVSGELTAG